MVIPRFFYQAMRNEPITVYGDGNQTRDFTYIDDTVLATLLVADKCKKNEIFNVARGVDTSIFDLAKLIIDITNSKSEIKNALPFSISSQHAIASSGFFKLIRHALL